MVDVKTGNGESGHSYGQHESHDGQGLVLRVADDQEEDGLAAEAAAVEQLPDVGGRHDLLPAKVICQLTSERHDDGHDEVRQRRQEGRLGQVKTEDFLEVLGLGDEEQVEGPGSGEVGDDDGVDGHAGEDATPGGGHDGRLLL